MITLFNTLWTNQNLSGILNWRLLPWCQLMKNSWNQLGKTLVAWNQMVSSTMVHTFWNPSLQNHKSSWIKTLITTTRKMFTSIRLNWLTSMDLTKTILLVTSQMGTYLLLVSSQQAQLTVRLRRNSRITSFIPHKILLFTTLTSTSTVKITAIRRRHLMSKRTTRRQPFKTKTSVKLWTSLWIELPTALKLTGKTEHQKLYVPF